MASIPRGVRIGCAVAALLVVLTLPWTVTDAYSVGQIEAIVLLALLMSSVNLTFGYAGEFALGQVPIYAVGAYSAGYAGIHWSSELFVTLPIAVLAGVVVGLITGVPALRLVGWTLGVVSIFLVVVLPNIINLTPDITGGVNGLPGIPRPSIFGTELTVQGIFALTVVVFVVWFASLRNLLLSRHGSALKALRQSPILTPSLGVSNYRLRLLVYLLGSIPAAVAGALLAYQTTFVSASSFSFAVVLTVLVGSVLGGLRSIYGPLIGATLLQVGPLRADAFGDSSLLIYGVVLVVIALLIPEGATELVRSVARRLLPTLRRPPGGAVSQRAPDGVPAPSDDSSRSLAASGAVVAVNGVRKSFGGVHALVDVALEAQPGRITALIGANGSGKTTLLNAVSAMIAVDGGSISVDRQECRGRSAWQMARLGVRRTFQTPIIPDGMSAWEVVANGRYGDVRIGVLRTMFRSPASRLVERDDRFAALQALHVCGLAEFAERPATDLPLGLRRLLEVARALAARPRLVLLDEPAAGLEDSEAAVLVKVVKRIRDDGMTVVLVEHNFALTRELADDVYVLDEGRVIAHGTADEVAADGQVQERYFGGYVPVTRLTEALP